MSNLSTTAVGRAEAATEASRAALVAEALPDAALLIDADAKVVWGNGAAVELFGRTLEASIGLNGLDFVHPEDQQLAMVSLVSMSEKDRGSLIELRVKAAEGWRLVELRGAAVGDDILLTMRDLTERRRWEVAGDETAQFRSVLQNARSVLMLIGADGTVSSSSGALTRQLGVDQEWLEGRQICELVDPLDHALLQESLRRLCSTSHDGAVDGVTVDLRMVSGRGEIVPFAMTFTNLLDDPIVEGIVATGHDVSDRVRTEDELRAANSVLAATLESTADGILVVDNDGGITSFNARFVEMWRLSRDLLASQDDAAALAVATQQLCDPQAFLSKVRELYADPDAVSHDTINFRDGRVFERDSLPQRIDGRVVGRVWSFRDITDRRRLEEELEHQAFHDPLTGLANKALFRDRLAQAAARLGRREGHLAVLFIDLDDFKTVNDSLGHSAGDELLVSVSERIGACLRPGDTAARLGGDEFAVLIDELTAPDDATNIAERILRSLREPILLHSTQVSADASIGIAYGSGSAEVDEMLRNADLAMYTAKSAGKDCYRLFAVEMHNAALERLDLEKRLRGAAGRGELAVHYQPIVDLSPRDGSERRIVAMEALVRWAHPDRGLLSPDAFIPFAEQGGLIEEIGNHVLVSACEEAAGWARLFGAAAPAVSVNLSPRQLTDPQLPDRVELLLHRSGLHAAQLILEITESALMHDPVSAASSLERLSSLGVRLAVDDFGTGYSSLAYLQRFPIDLLKIDGSFVDDELAEPGWSLAEAIVQITHALGVVPIAEGVETQVQADALAGFGCNMAQGFHLGRPLDADLTRALISGSVARRLGADQAQS